MVVVVETDMECRNAQRGCTVPEEVAAAVTERDADSPEAYAAEN